MRFPGGGGDGELRYIVVVSVLSSVRAEERLWKMGELLAGLLVACSEGLQGSSRRTPRNTPT